MPTEKPQDGKCNTELSRDRGFCNGAIAPDSEEGNCVFHHEDPEKNEASPGPPDNNQNATKHGLYAKPENYHKNYPDVNEEFIGKLEAALFERYERINGSEPDFFDKVVIRNISIDLEQLPGAYQYIQRNGLTQDKERIEEGALFVDEVPNVLLQEIRKQNESVIKRMKDLGLLNDPETKKANALDGSNISDLWNDGEETDVIDVDFTEL